MSSVFRPFVVDLFCGAGGLSLGFEQAGFRIAIGIDKDPINVATHGANFPNSIGLVADISKLHGSDIRRLGKIGKRRVDVVVGGPPCQGFSLMGKRSPTDPRNRLIYDFIRIVGELKPMYFVMENVDGLAKGSARRILFEFQNKARALGYRLLDPQIIDAQNCGVPQRRRRLFLVGYRRGFAAPRMLKNEQHTKSPGHAQPSVWDAIRDLTVLERDSDLVRTDMFNGPLGEASHYALELRGLKKDHRDRAFKRSLPCGQLSGCRRSAHTRLTVKRFSATKPGHQEPVSKFFRLTKRGTSPVLRAGTPREYGGFTAPRPIHPIFPRCITVREAARLHSFPDWFQFDRTIWHGFRQVGNSVPPRMGREVGLTVLAAVRKSER